MQDNFARSVVDELAKLNKQFAELGAVFVEFSKSVIAALPRPEPVPEQQPAAPIAPPTPPTPPTPPDPSATPVTPPTPDATPDPASQATERKSRK